jgi:phosphoribosylglycinamide formyltransferase-1
VHYVTNELDGGPPILQARVPIRQNDTEVTLAARILEYEHKIFPEAVNWHLEGRLCQHAEGAVLDGKKLSTAGVRWSSPECV